MARRSAIKQKCRILFLSHSHPYIRHGGAEIAAFALFTAFCDSDSTEAWFLGCDTSRKYSRLGIAITQPFSEREYIYTPTEFDWFKLANRDPAFPAEFENILRLHMPDVVHFHHYIHLGVEAFSIVRRILPNARIVLTLHEYNAICHNSGQMITTSGRMLCHAGKDTACADCFSSHTSADFFLRRLYIQRFLNDIDYFIAPSIYLLEKYKKWGIPAEKLQVIENMISPAPDADLQLPDTTILRIGLFGQLSWLKGCHVLFDTAALLLAAGITDIHFHIHGDHTAQSPEIQADFLQTLKTTGPNVTFHGPYHHDDVDQVMATVHAVLVPSLWWENSPVVIQEALRNRRPVICTNIGGMAEKIRDGLDGLHFRRGDPQSLAKLLKSLRADPDQLHRLQHTMRAPPSPGRILDQHKAVYSTARISGRMKPAA